MPRGNIGPGGREGERLIGHNRHSNLREGLLDMGYMSSWALQWCCCGFEGEASRQPYIMLLLSTTTYMPGVVPSLITPFCTYASLDTYVPTSDLAPLLTLSRSLFRTDDRRHRHQVSRRSQGNVFAGARCPHPPTMGCGSPGHGGWKRDPGCELAVAATGERECAARPWDAIETTPR